MENDDRTTEDSAAELGARIADAVLTTGNLLSSTVNRIASGPDTRVPPLPPRQPVDPSDDGSTGRGSTSGSDVLRRDGAATVEVETSTSQLAQTRTPQPPAQSDERLDGGNSRRGSTVDRVEDGSVNSGSVNEQIIAQTSSNTGFTAGTLGSRLPSSSAQSDAAAAEIAPFGAGALGASTTRPSPRTELPDAGDSGRGLTSDGGAGRSVLGDGSIIQEILTSTLPSAQNRAPQPPVQPAERLDGNTSVNPANDTSGNVGNTQEPQNFVVTRNSDGNIFSNFAPNRDLIEFNGFSGSATATVTRSGNDTVVTVGDVSVTLQDVRPNQLTADNVVGVNLPTNLSGSRAPQTANRPDGNSPLNPIEGTNGNDELLGTEAADQINGRGGNDFIFGNGGNDFIRGGRGADFLSGNVGNDTLSGNAGRDQFVFNPGDGNDGITDFQPGLDVLDFGPFNGTPNATVTQSGRDTVVRVGDVSVTLEGVAPGQLSANNFFGVNLPTNLSGSRAPQTANRPDGNSTLNPIEGTNRGETLEGSDRRDQINGRGGDDTIFGNRGDDVIFGNGGNDFIRGGRGADFLSGNDGNDTLSGNAGQDQFLFNPGDGNDRITDFQPGQDVLDFLGFPIAPNVTVTRSGTDTVVRVGDVSVTLEGVAPGQLTAGNFIGVNLPTNVSGSRAPQTPQQVANRSDGNATLNVVDGNDAGNVLRGGSGPDRINGRGGDDIIFGNRGNDVITGGGGRDQFVFRTGDGNDRITDFQPGQDVLDFGPFSGTPNATVRQDGNNTVVTVGDVNVTLEGVRPNQLTADNVVGVNLPTNLSVSRAPQTPQQTANRLDGNSPLNPINGTDGNDELPGTEAADRISGRQGNDVIVGNEGNDLLLGGSGIDRIFGGSGNDRIDGGAGNDVIFGGRDDDILRGGGGNDRFAFRDGDGSDRIVDFAPGQDQLDFRSFDGTPNAIVRQDGNDTVVTVENVSVRLNGVAPNQLTADNVLGVTLNGVPSRGSDAPSAPQPGANGASGQTTQDEDCSVFLVSLPADGGGTVICVDDVVTTLDSDGADSDDTLRELLQARVGGSSSDTSSLLPRPDDDIA